MIRMSWQLAGKATKAQRHEGAQRRSRLTTWCGFVSSCLGGMILFVQSLVDQNPRLECRSTGQGNRSKVNSTPVAPLGFRTRLLPSSLNTHFEGLPMVAGFDCACCCNTIVSP